MDNAVMMEEEAANSDHLDAGRRRFAPPEDEATWHMPTDDERSPYTKDTVFTRSQLLGINPTVIKRWLVNKAYGKEEYDRKRDVPQGARASLLEMMKKAVSYFMTNRAVAWVNGAGNPTRHASVHEVIADVKKAEARHQGRSSQATRPLREPEFRKSLEMLKRKSDWNSQYKYSIMSLWQFAIIARTDDIVHFEVTHPRGNPKFPFTLKLKVFWSKNINEERQCPDQILLGPMDDDICILINLSIYLESYLEQFPQAVLLFTEDLELANDAATERLKARYRSALRSTWNTAEFKSTIDESDFGLKIGTHSQRKLPATYASNKGCSKPEIEIRGRWQGEAGKGPKVVDRYIDRKHEYIDGKVAAALCIGGPVKYKLKEGVELPVEWLYENVIPNIRAKFPRDNRLCRVLALTLLYACMHEDILVPPGIKSRVRTAYGELNQDTQQPVEKVPLFVHRRDDQLMIDEAIIIDGDGSTGAGGGVVAGNSPYDLFQSIQINIQQLQQQLNNVAARSDTNFSDLRAYIQHRDRILNNNIRAFGGTIEGGLQIQQANAGRRLLPLAARGANVDVGPVEAANMAILSGNPRSLYGLWREYQHGIAGRKPARYFTATERNCSRQMKQKFYRRKQVWDTISRLVANGHTVQSIDGKVAAALCIGGPVKYKLKEGVELPVEWLYENVIPNIRAKFPRDNRLCRVLALTLLYACMHEDILVPPGIKSRVRTAYGELNQDTQQPVEKVPLFVHRRDDQLMIDEAIIIDGDGSTGAGGGVVAGNSTYDLFQSIQINIQQLQQQLNNVAARSDTNFSDLRAYIQHRDRILNNNIRAFGGTIEGGLQIQQANAGRRLLPLAARGANVDVGPVEAANMAILSGNPRSLYGLWREYQHGIAGRKPARYFTATERNCSRQMKQKFYRRKQVWDTISRLVANGHTVQSIDGKVAAALCIGGPVKYKLKEGVELPVEWLYENVIPNIRAKFPRDNRLCRVLALTLLYACMHEDILVPPGIKSRVRTAYGELNQDTQQPVEKVPLFVHRRDDQLMIDEAIIIDGDGSTGAGGGVVAGNSTYDLFQSIQINIQQLQQQLNNVAARSDTNFSDLRAYIQHRDRILNNNIRAFGGTIEGGLQIQQANAGRRLLPLAARGANVDVGPVEAANMAILSGNPRSLYGLWREYQHGIAGRKPARYFTATERNCSRQMKQKFYRRKQVWDTISRLVANGHTVQSAIERIKQVYG